MKSLTPNEAAAYAGYTRNSLATMRHTRSGPKFFRDAAGRPRYSVRELDRYMASKGRVRPAQENANE